MIRHRIGDALRPAISLAAIVLLAVALQACGRKEEVPAAAPAAFPAPTVPTPSTDVLGSDAAKTSSSGYRVTASKKDLDGSEVD